MDNSLIQYDMSEYQLQDLREEKLPIVVKPVDKSIELGPGVDTKAPFLLYSRRRRTKVYAECMRVDKKNKSLTAYGPIFEIPKDYTGWFEVFPSDGTQPQPSTDLKELTQCKQMLVRTTIHAFVCECDDIDLKAEVKIYPGEVLSMGMLIKKQWKLADSSNSSSLPETTFIQCSNHQGQSMCIPIAHPGLFNPIYDPKLTTSNPENSVYQIADLLDSQFPAVVRLAFGWPPWDRSSKQFNGVLQLVGLRRPDSMVLCNMQRGKTVLLEVPTDMDLKLVKASNLDELKRDANYKELVKRCYDKVYQFVISIKPMTVRYPLLVPDHGGSTYRKFTEPIDMDQFNPLEVYPPLEKHEQPGEFFQLSFRDPDESTFDGGSRSGLASGAEFSSRGESNKSVEEVTRTLSDGLTGPKIAGQERSNLRNMRQQYNKQMEERESLA